MPWIVLTGCPEALVRLSNPVCDDLNVTCRVCCFGHGRTHINLLLCFCGNAPSISLEETGGMCGMLLKVVSSLVCSCSYLVQHLSSLRKVLARLSLCPQWPMKGDYQVTFKG